LDVPCGPIMSTQDLATDEHVKGRDMWVEIDHPQRGKWFNVGMPIKLSASPAKIERSPLLGEHTDEVLKSVLGYDDGRIASLRGADAVKAMRDLGVDIGIMAFVLQFAPQEFVKIPRHGTIQYHPSLLPRYRGPSSINWPLIKGETKTGLTIFRPTDGLDEG